MTDRDAYLELDMSDLQSQCQQFLLSTQEALESLRGHRLDALDARELIFLDVRIRVEELLKRIELFEYAPNGPGRSCTAHNATGPGCLFNNDNGEGWRS